MAHLAWYCSNCSAFPYMCWVNGNALPGSHSQGPHRIWWDISTVPCTSFQSNMLKINIFSSITVISNCFSVYYYSLLLQKRFQTLLTSGVFVMLHNTNSRSLYHLPTQRPAGFSLKFQLQTQGKLRYAQVTSPRLGQSAVGGESHEEGASAHPGLSP